MSRATTGFLWAFDLRRFASAALYRHFILLRLIAAIKHYTGPLVPVRERVSARARRHCVRHYTAVCTPTAKRTYTRAKRYAASLSLSSLSRLFGMGVAPSENGAITPTPADDPASPKSETLLLSSLSLFSLLPCSLFFSSFPLKELP